VHGDSWVAVWILAGALHGMCHELLSRFNSLYFNR
jgi:hypothetical protein